MIYSKHHSKMRGRGWRSPPPAASSQKCTPTHCRIYFRLQGTLGRVLEHSGCSFLLPLSQISFVSSPIFLHTCVHNTHSVSSNNLNTLENIKFLSWRKFKIFKVKKGEQETKLKSIFLYWIQCKKIVIEDIPAAVMVLYLHLTLSWIKS